jgi:protocatechuate 3,4-dioxygenase beta subunit
MRATAALHRHDGDHGDEHRIEEHDRGLAYDVATLMGRRRTLKVLSGAGLAVLVGCGSGSGGGQSSAGEASSSSTAAASGAAGVAGNGGSGGDGIPEETAGPYPADGSNGVNVLTESGIVRSDIRSSFGSASGVADGVALMISLTVRDSGTDQPLPGVAVYLWHCDREGAYSLYSPGATGENYLRGVQEAGSDGAVTFTSIFPACYDGRWPHVHFEVYPSLAEATAAGTPTATSQLAFPEDVCATVYATSGYEQSIRTMSQVSLDTDMVFADGYDEQLATMTGDVDRGYTATLALPV